MLYFSKCFIIINIFWIKRLIKIKKYVKIKLKKIIKNINAKH